MKTGDTTSQTQRESAHPHRAEEGQSQLHKVLWVFPGSRACSGLYNSWAQSLHAPRDFSGTAPPVHCQALVALCQQSDAPDMGQDTPP